MKILGPGFLEEIGCPMINTHPALLPAFPGAHPVADALAYGVKVTGATVHLVDDGVDTGPVLAQAAVEVRSGDTADDLHERIKIEERRLLVGTVAALAREGATVTGREVTHPVSRANAGAAAAPVRRALVSVYDKAGLTELAEGLHELGVEIVSTGSTAQRIADAGVPVTPVEELTGFPECLDGRVKTLHPRVHAGLLADTRRPEHTAQLDELGIAPFELLVANLYPFTETVASGAAPDECVEQIDIGGPAMVRAWAKNHDSVAVVVDPERYDVGARAGRGRRVRPRRPPPARRRRVPAHRHLRRRRRLLAGQRARPRRRRPVPGLGRRDLGAGRDAALRREPAPGRGALHRRQGRAGRQRSSCTARRCPTTTTSTPTPPGAPRTTTATCGRDHQARQPVRHRGRRGRRRGAPQGARDATRSARSAA